jgi:GxxExxY protein
MPIESPMRFERVPDTVFDSIDRSVMDCAYAAQNKLGRLCDERVYENDVAARLRAQGFIDVHTQLPLTVTHRTFRKLYLIDLVVNGIVYELKVADCFVPANDVQVIHYAALLGLDRIKLVNFGAACVQGALRRCPFARIDRWRVTVNRSRWQALTEACAVLAADAEACLRDWGGFLEGRLFEEALVWFNGGQEVCVRRLPVTCDGHLLGSHQTALHAEDVGFVVTALAVGVAAHEDQLRRLLEALPIRAWQWINVHHAEMSLVTLVK